MEFIQIDAKDYDEAIKIARQRYGSSVRIQSRCTYPSFFGKKGHTKINCYLTSDNSIKDAKDKVVEKPESIEAPSGVISQMRKTLFDNDFSSTLIERVIGDLVWEDAKDLTEMELRLVNALVDSASVNRYDILHPPKFFVLHGSSAVGKTLSLLKLSMFYTASVDEMAKKSICVLSLGGSTQLNSICELHDIEIIHTINPDSLRDFSLNESKNYDLVLIDTGEIDEDLRAAMLQILPEESTGHYFCANARYKLSELVSSYTKIESKYPLRSVIVTMCDEAYSIGNILSFCNQLNISLLFFSSGRNMSRGLHPANGAYIMSLFHGFSLDFKSMWENADKGGLLD
ncbi:MAG: hypothetical protein JJE21_00295 [Spirochaetaceae bacterium]|nr:hypothetical protein [Spirochaetaceae bacterium]